LNIKLTTLIFPTIGICVFVFGLGHFIGATSVPSEDKDFANSDVTAIDTIPTQIEADTPKLDSVESLLTGLEGRLKDEPSDIGGWILLSKTYLHLNRWQQANEAFTTAKDLGYAGDWQPLIRSGSTDLSIFSFDSTAPKIDFNRYQSSSSSNLLLNLDNEKIANISNSNVTEVGPTGLKLALSLSPDLASNISPDTLLFIFVRKVSGSGAPLAVARRQVKDLPLEITLNDRDAMISNMNISSVDQVVVGARISLTGAPNRQPGDYEQLSPALPSDYSEAITLIIKEKISI
jgi:hypothetical protein